MKQTIRESDTTNNTGRILIGGLLLLLALAASLALSLQHFARLELPGCGPGSDCAKAAASVWGSIPGINYPVSLVGLAYFAAVLAAWITAHGRISGLLRIIILLGGVISLGYIAVMAAERLWCSYCTTAQLANLAFATVALTTARAMGQRSATPIIAGLVAFLLVTSVASIAQVQVQGHQEQQLQESAQRVIEQSRQAPPDATATLPSATATPSTPAPSSPDATMLSTAATLAETLSSGGEGGGGFTGRWRLGPEASPIRIVIFTDYQCSDCKRIDGEIEALQKRFPDLSVSVRYFPMSSKCNENMGSSDPHPNACWAARAAEAAGILRGPEGFWQMHRWLFSQDGSFTDASLPGDLRRMGHDPNQLIQVMMSEQTLKPVREDIAQGVQLGLFFTPLIFVNGVEIRGWNIPGGFTRAVEKIAASNPPPRTAAWDRAPTAADKIIGDWREQPSRQLPPDATAHQLGQGDAPVEIIVWGDYQEPFTQRLDTAIRALQKQRGDTVYFFHHYPVNQSCNPHVPKTMFPQSCLAARATEAAGRVGGEDAFWTMHAWLMEHPAEVNEAAFKAAAAAQGLDPVAFATALDSPEVAREIKEDVDAGKQVIPQGVPTMYINGRWASRWELKDEGSLLDRIVDAARQ
jgi:protein-disulfide isomerase